MREEMGRKVLISRQSRYFSFILNMIKVFSLFVTSLGVQKTMFPAKEKKKFREPKKLVLFTFVLLKHYSHFVTQVTVVDWKLIPH